jgi:hypothetical protein
MDWYMADLTGAELKVALYIARRTFGFKKDSDSISISQIANGIVKKSGERLDRGTGLGRSTVIEALKSLIEAHGLVIARRQKTEAGDDDVNVYELNLEDEVVQKVDYPSPESGLPGSRNQTTGVVQNLDPQPTVIIQPTVDNQNTLPSFLEPEPLTFLEPDPLSLISLHKTLCSKFKALRKSGGLQKPLRDLVAERVERVYGWSEPQVLDVFHVWCSTMDWEGFDGRHRVNSFFSFLQSCDPSDFPVNAPAEPAIESPTPSRRSGAADSAMGPETRKVDFPARWNLLVPEASTDPALLPLCPKAYRDPVFAERFDEICAKASALIRDGADLKFGFLLKESGGRFRWQELLADELAWMKPKPTGKSNTGPDPAKAMIEDLLRKRKAKGYEAGTP